MTGEALFETMGLVEDRFLDVRPGVKKRKCRLVQRNGQREQKRTIPVFERKPAMDLKRAFAAAACLLAVVAAVAIVPHVIDSGHQLPSAGVVSVNSHIHVIFRDYAQLDELLLMERRGEALTDWLKETGLWNQGVKNEEDVAYLQELIHATPIPRLNGKLPDSLEVLEDKPGIFAGFEGVSLFVHSGTEPLSLPDGAQRLTEDPAVYLTDTAEGINGENAYHLTGIAHDHPFTATVRASELTQVLELLGDLSFLCFDTEENSLSGMAGIYSAWELDRQTGTLRLYAQPALYLDANDSKVQGEAVLPPIAVHGLYTPWQQYAEVIRHVKVEGDVKMLGRGVITALPNLESVSLPGGLTFIGGENFTQCPITHITVPAEVEYLGEGFASQCQLLRSVTFRTERLKTAGAILSDCPQLQYAQWASSMEQWQDLLAENEHLSLLEVVCAADALAGDGGWENYCGVQWRWNEAAATLAFRGSGSIEYNDEYPWWELRDQVKTLIVGEGITETGPNVFPLSKVERVYLPSTLRNMGNVIFEGCKKLQWIILPEGITEIPNAAFSQCKKLEYVNIPESVTKLGSLAFEGCSSLRSIRLPNGISFMGDSAFSGCASLEEIRLSDSLRQVRQGVYYDCKALKRIWLPAGIKLLDDVSFYGCKALKDVYFGGTQAQWEQVNISERAYLPQDATVHFESDAAVPVVPEIDTWTGEYRNGELKLEHVVDAATDVRIEVLELTVSFDADTPHGSEGYVTLLVHSQKEQIVELWMKSQQGDDYGLTLERATFLGKTGEGVRLEQMRFEGWKAYSYYLVLEAGNTRISIRICPDP